MLHIIELACTFSDNRATGVVVIQSDMPGPPFIEAWTELESVNARHMAQSFAATKGIMSAYINGNVIGPYPVNAEGLSLESIKDGDGKPLPPAHPRMQPRHFRIDVPVCRPLG